jgi:glucosyl-3-phosphoglycerate synthase
MELPLSPEIDDWFTRRTFTDGGMSLNEALEAKERKGVRLAVCLPALNEVRTIGSICEVVRTRLVEPGLVDELIVIDSGSGDGTPEAAAAAGAKVHRAKEILADRTQPLGGKGESLWKTLAVTHAGLMVWLDSDVENFDEHFVLKLVSPLLADEGIMFVKAFYERPLRDAGGSLRSGGARVTELVARPLIQLLRPELTGFVQPLSGECAARREVLIELPFSTGYGVEIGLLLDVLEACGLHAMAQVDLGVRVHRNRPTLDLGRMSFEVAHALLSRLDRAGRIKLSDELPSTFTQFFDEGAGPQPRTWQPNVSERPPMIGLL